MGPIFLILFLISTSVLKASDIIDRQECISQNGQKIEYFEKLPRENGLKKKILIFAQIHGDEPQSGLLAYKWISRLERIKSPSNHWRIIANLNPDGVKNKSRTNANKVDLNRNFPTNDWDKLAILEWKKKHKSDPRRFPGTSAASEPETKCALFHINDFKPEIVISIHAPYGLLDFDGPLSKKINSKTLPWKRLGTYPGSLGRYLWNERNIPVLTLELGAKSLKNNSEDFLKLQDDLSDLLVK